MDLTNLTIGQKLYSAINGEVIFDGYIENPQGEKYLICCKKDKLLHYYFLDGKFNKEGRVILFTNYQKVTKGTITEEISIQIRGCSKEEIILKSYNPTKTIAEIIEIYNEILNSDYVTEEMLCDNNLMAEEIWQRLQ